MKLYKMLMDNNVKIDKDLYDYGYTILKNYLIIFFSVLIFSIWSHTVTETILFSLFLLTLRRYLGGFHFSNHRICNLFSFLLIIIVPIISDNIRISFLSLVCVFVIIITISIYIGPVDHYNKRISHQEKQIYKRKSILIEIIYFFLALVCNYFSLNNIMNIIFLTMMVNSLSLIISKMFYK